MKGVLFVSRRYTEGTPFLLGFGPWGRASSYKSYWSNMDFCSHYVNRRKLGLSPLNLYVCLKSVWCIFNFSGSLPPSCCQGMSRANGNIKYQQPLLVWHYCSVCTKIGSNLSSSAEPLLLCLHWVSWLYSCLIPALDQSSGSGGFAC